MAATKQGCYISIVLTVQSLLSPLTIVIYYKIRLEMKRILSIDLGRCSECMGCIEIAPEVFRYNEATGRLEVVDLAQYSKEMVWEAIKNCPRDCIYWEDID